eukprot:8512801-Alexandrium_andersonii.AAC.1
MLRRTCWQAERLTARTTRPWKASKVARLRAFAKRVRESQVAVLADPLDRGLAQHARTSHVQRSHWRAARSS